MLLSNCKVYGSKKSRFIKKQEPSGIISSLAKTLNNIPIIGPVLFFRYKINEIINKFSLAGNKLIHEMHLRQPGFTYRACGPFTKNTEKRQESKETGDSRYIYQKELDKA